MPPKHKAQNFSTEEIVKSIDKVQKNNSLVNGINVMFPLRKISISELNKKYFSGELENIEYKIEEEEENETQETNFRSEYPRESKNEPKFSIRDKTNDIVHIASINSNGKCTKCHHCMIDYKDDPLIDFEKEHVKIPIKRVETKNGKIYYGDKFFCCTPCADAKLRTLEGSPLLMRDSKYMNSRCYLLEMHNEMYPGTQLVPSLDADLLIENGGSLTREEFFTGNKLFKRTSNILLEPVRILYSDK